MQHGYEKRNEFIEILGTNNSEWWDFRRSNDGSTQYALCGGGVPIKIKGVGVIGVILLSGLDHITDHNMIVEQVANYLKTPVEMFDQVDL